MKTTTEWINILASIYVALPIAVTIIIMVLYLIGKGISKEAIDKLLEFGKWYMVAVAIVFAAKLLDASFTDRETSIKEIAIYDKYAANILEADNIEKRWKLTEYFAAVTPSEDLRDRWDAYKIIIKPEYDNLVELKNRERKIIASSDTLSAKQKTELLFIKEQQNTYNVKLANSKNDLYVIVFTADTNLKQAQYENINLKKAGVIDAIIVNVGSLYFNISKDYNSKGDASSQLEKFRYKIRRDVYISYSSKFCKTKFNTDYYSCE